MATITTAGRDLFIQNVTIGVGQTAITIPTSLSTAYRVNSMIIRCRTSVDMQLTKSKGDGNYFTIPAGSALTLDLNPATSPCFYLTSTSGSIIAEILFTLE